MYDRTAQYQEASTGLLLLTLSLCAVAVVPFTLLSFAPIYSYAVLLVAGSITVIASRPLSRIVRRSLIPRVVLGLSTAVLAAAYTYQLLAPVLVLRYWMGPRTIPFYILLCLMAAASTYVAVWGLLIAVGASRTSRYFAFLILCVRQRRRTQRSPTGFQLRTLTGTAPYVLIIEVLIALVAVALALWLNAGTRFGPPVPPVFIAVQVLAAPLLAVSCVAFTLIAARLLGIRVLRPRPLGHAG